MVFSIKQQQFGKDKYIRLPSKCRKCKYMHLCFGACPKNRFLLDDQKNMSVNYLCSGYQTYFKTTAPYFEKIKIKLLENRSPVEIMEDLRQN